MTRDLFFFPLLEMIYCFVHRHEMSVCKSFLKIKIYPVTALGNHIETWWIYVAAKRCSFAWLVSFPAEDNLLTSVFEWQIEKINPRNRVPSLNSTCWRTILLRANFRFTTLDDFHRQSAHLASIGRRQAKCARRLFLNINGIFLSLKYLREKYYILTALTQLCFLCSQQLWTNFAVFYLFAIWQSLHISFLSSGCIPLILKVTRKTPALKKLEA